MYGGSHLPTLEGHKPANHERCAMSTSQAKVAVTAIICFTVVLVVLILKTHIP